MLVYLGKIWMEASIRSVYTWKNLRQDRHEPCRTCHKCQMSKKSSCKKYGHLPPKERECLMCSCVNVDLWGPATINNKARNTYKIHVLTMIDPTTGWFELATLGDGPTSLEKYKGF